MQDAVIIDTAESPTSSVIWLHGLGADGHDFEPIVPELRLPGSLPLRFIFPHAPVRPVTINNGMSMRAWFDIKSFDRNGDTDSRGIDESCRRLDAIVDAEIARGVASDRILLAGFSQGGVIAMHTALRSNLHFAGLMVLSSYLPLVDRLQSYPTPASLPVFWGHGQFDPVLTLDMGRASCATLEALGLQPEWHDYPMAHAVCPQEIDDIRRWMLRVYGVDAPT